MSVTCGDFSRLSKRAISWAVWGGQAGSGRMARQFVRDRVDHFLPH